MAQVMQSKYITAYSGITTAYSYAILIVVYPHYWVSKNNVVNPIIQNFKGMVDATCDTFIEWFMALVYHIHPIFRKSKTQHFLHSKPPINGLV